MITTSLLPNGDVLVTFMIDDERPVSVVGDFNGWDPHRDPFVEELDGRRYVTVSVPADTVTSFRYLADGGEFFDDPAADRIEPNGFGQDAQHRSTSPALPSPAMNPPRRNVTRTHGHVRDLASPAAQLQRLEAGQQAGEVAVEPAGAWGASGSSHSQPISAPSPTAPGTRSRPGASM